MNNFEQKKTFAGRLSNLFLSNKQLALLTILTLVFWGVLSFLIMPKQYNPKIVAPAFRVTTEFPGANSQEVYELITRPMENKLKEIPQVDKIMAVSYDGGVSVVTVQYYIGENMEDAKISLIEKLGSNMEFKPSGANDPEIKAIDPEEVPIINIALTSDEYSPESLRSLAWDIADELRDVEGAAKFEVKGSENKQLSVLLSQDKMNFFDVSVFEVISSIENNNLSLPVGQIESGSNNFDVKIDGNIQDEQDLGKLVVKQKADGVVYLEDVADISYDTGVKESDVRFWEKGDSSKSAVFLAVSKLSDSNATTVSKNIQNKLDNLRDGFISSGVEVSVVRDDGRVANEAVIDLSSSLFLSVIIVSLVLLFFLGWRSALVVSVSIPLTLAAVFGVGNLFGQTINRITLFALILSLGLLVDNATVVVENVYRLLRKNPDKNKKETIVKAVDEVGGGLIMSTVTTILAFYPMSFVTGMMGPYMGPIPFFVPAALLASLFIAFTINPYFLSLLSGSGLMRKQNESSAFSKVVTKIKKVYRQILQKLLDSRRLRVRLMVGVLILFFISISLPAFKIVKFRMLPKADKEQFYVYLDLPQYSSFERTDQEVVKLEKLLLQKENVNSVQSYVGEAQVIDFNGLFKGSDARFGQNQATLKVNLTHPSERKQTSEKIVLTLRPEILEIFEDSPDVKIKIIEDPPGPPVLSTFLIKVKGDNERVVSEITRDVENKALTTEKVVDVDTNLNENAFQKTYFVDKEKANLSGLSSAQIVTATKALLGGIEVGIYHQQEKEGEPRKPEQELIVVRFEKEDYDAHLDLEKILLTSVDGKRIPLSELVYESDDSITPSIYSDERKKAMYVSAEMADRSVAYSVIDAFVFLLDYKLPSGNGEITDWSLYEISYLDQSTGEKFSIALDGEWKLTLDVFRDLGIAMGVAIFLIYFVLVGQFKSLKVPLLVMGTIPLAMIGVLPGFALLGFVSGIFFNATSMIGVIALSGIVVNNAIILLEYIKDLKKRSYTIENALLEAGSTRLLPIMLTSMTTILGSLTIIKDPVWSGLAWAIVWGLSLSSFLTLIIFPVLYYTFEKKNWKAENNN